MYENADGDYGNTDSTNQGALSQQRRNPSNTKSKYDHLGAGHNPGMEGTIIGQMHENFAKLGNNRLGKGGRRGYELGDISAVSQVGDAEKLVEVGGVKGAELIGGEVCVGEKCGRVGVTELG